APCAPSSTTGPTPWSRSPRPATTRRSAPDAGRPDDDVAPGRDRGGRRPSAPHGGLRAGRRHGQLVGPVVPHVAVVALHPLEGDVAPGRHQVDQRLPQVPVGHRLLLAVPPAPPLPPLPPAVAE